MKVYEVHLLGYHGPCVHNKLDQALTEIEELLKEGTNGTQISIAIPDMTEEQYNNLSEFQGY